MKLPPKIEGDWDDIPSGINYCTSLNMKMISETEKAVGGYYASVAFVVAQVGKDGGAKGVRSEDNTIVIFTSDHGFHLGEHDSGRRLVCR